MQELPFATLKIHCHEYCPKLDQDLLEQNKQKDWVLLLHYKELLEHKVLIPDVIDVSIKEQGHCYVGQSLWLLEHL